MAKNDDKQFSKTDMERMGIFQEMGYISKGDRYVKGGSGNIYTLSNFMREMHIRPKAKQNTS